MSEKLCLQWNDFHENVNSAFGRLRDDKEFTDVTLACEDGQHLEAHKVILAASSPFFEKILQRNKHPHPLIYLRGFHSQDLVTILDFLYFGETKVFQENMDAFLKIAEELKLKGLTGLNSSDLLEDEDKSTNPKPVMSNTKEPRLPDVNTAEKVSRKLASRSSVDTQVLNDMVKSMMKRGKNMITTRSHGTKRNTTTSICKVCGKEGQPSHIRDHIEANHLEGISISCDVCGKATRTRANLRQHKAKFHK